jgi:deoxyribonuclease V
MVSGKKTSAIVWPASIADAIAIQKDLCTQVVTRDDFGTIKAVAGVDLSHKEEISRCAIVALDAKTMEVVETAQAEMPVRFPYVTGLLSFREIPVILETLAKLKYTPDMLMMDGAGYAHPRRIGVASHLGVLTGLPVIGVAKSRLCGTHAEPGLRKGAMVRLMDKGECIGTVLRSRDGCRPLYVSPGHRIGFDSSVKWVMKCLKGYRLPEPTRLADKLSKR